MAAKHFTLSLVVVLLLSVGALAQHNDGCGMSQAQEQDSGGAASGACSLSFNSGTAIGNKVFGLQPMAPNLGEDVAPPPAPFQDPGMGAQLWGAGGGPVGFFMPQRITTPGIYQGLWPTANTGRLHDGPTSLRIITENMLGNRAGDQQNTRLAVAALIMGAGGFSGALEPLSFKGTLTVREFGIPATDVYRGVRAGVTEITGPSWVTKNVYEAQNYAGPNGTVLHSVIPTADLNTVFRNSWEYSNYGPPGSGALNWYRVTTPAEMQLFNAWLK